MNNQQTDEEKERVAEIRRTVIKTDVKPDEMVKAYDSWAATYEQDMLTFYSNFENNNPPKMAANLLESLFNGRKLADLKILDCACGTGLVGVELKKKGFCQLDALDSSPEMLEKAREKNIYGRIICDMMGKNKLDIEESTYDGNVCTGAFAPGHVSGDCFEELIRITKPGGFCVFSIREEYLLNPTVFKDTIEQQMQDLCDKGMWKRVARKREANYIDGIPAIVYVYQPTEKNSSRS